MELKRGFLMSKRANRSTPIVISGTLYTDDEATTGTRVGSPAWFAWLEAAITFYYDSYYPRGVFTARCEPRQRGGRYWIAYRRRAGRLYRVHLGKADHLTRERLDEVVLILN